MAIKSLEGREEWGQGGEYNGGSTMGGVQWGEYKGGEYNGGSSRKQMSSPSYGRCHFVQSKFPKGDHLAKEKR